MEKNTIKNILLILIVGYLCLVWLDFAFGEELPEINPMSIKEGQDLENLDVEDIVVIEHYPIERTLRETRTRLMNLEYNMAMFEAQMKEFKKEIKYLKKYLHRMEWLLVDETGKKIDKVVGEEFTY